MEDHETYKFGQEVVPGYTLQVRLGSGMAGDVWIARAAGGTEVAVKIVQLKDIGGVKDLRGLLTVRNVKHPNLCPIHGFWLKDASGRLLDEHQIDRIIKENIEAQEKENAQLNLEEGTLDMGTVRESQADSWESWKSDEELVEAQELILVMALGERTLADELERIRKEAGIDPGDYKTLGGMDAKTTINILRDAAKAIDELNKNHGIYHCDIKPKNILVCGPSIWVCDFGLANKLKFDRDTGELHKTQSPFYTPPYAAPEVFDYEFHSTVDQYSLAVTYFEMRTGTFPFTATTARRIQASKMAGEFDFKQLSNAERKVLEKAMDVEPSNRYDSCGDMIDALAIASGVERPPGMSKKSLALSTMCVALLVAAGVWVAFKYLDVGASAQRNIARADGLHNEYVASKDQGEEYQVLETQLQMELVELADGFAIAAPDEQATIFNAALTATNDLISEIREELDDGNVDNLGSRLDKDVDYLHTFLDGAVFTEFEPADPRQAKQVEQVRRDLALADVQLGLIDNQQKYSENDTQLLRDSLDDRKDALTAVVLALTHDTTDRQGSHYSEEPAFADIVTATTLVRNSGVDSLPEWCRADWGEMQGEFLDEFRSAADGELPVSRSRLKTINDTWKNLLVEQQFMEMQALMKLGNWGPARELVEQLRDPSKLDWNDSDSTDLDRDELDWMTRLFDSMLVTLDQSPTDGEAVSAVNHVTDSLLQRPVESTRKVADAVARWHSDLASRVESEATRFEFEEARDLFGAARTLATSISRDPPSPFGSVLMAAAVRKGPSSYQDEDVQLAVDAGGREETTQSGAFLANAIQLEQAVYSGGDPAEPDWFDDFADHDVSTLNESLTPAYVEFVRSQIHWAGRKRDDAVQVWASLQSDSSADRTRAQLGTQRCRWIGESLLKIAIEKSQVTNELQSNLQSRFENSDAGREHVRNAKRWMWGDAIPSAEQLAESDSTVGLDSHQNLAIQLMLLEIAERRQRDQSLADIDRTLVARLLDGPTEAELGQAYLGLYLVSRAACDERASETVDPDSIRTLVDACAAILSVADDRDLRRKGSDLVDLVLDPALATLIAVSPRRADRSFFEVPDSVDHGKLAVICDQYLQTASLPRKLQSDESLYRQLEFAAALSINLDDMEPPEQSRRLLDAVGHLKSQHDLSGRYLWNKEELDFHSNYLDAARDLDPQNPVIPLEMALGGFYDAKRRGKGGKQLLSAVIDELKQPIRILEESHSNTVHLYDAYWRSANILVNLAFETSRADMQQKSSYLRQAVQNADKACDLVAELRQKLILVSETNAYLTKGNGLEDLAFYCSTPNTEEQHEIYREAISAFEFARDVARSSERTKCRYSLARCRTRFWDHGGSKSELDRALNDLGDYDAEADATSQLKWLGWSMNVNRRLEDQDAATRDAELALKLIEGQPKDVFSSRAREQHLLLVADVFSQDQGERVEIAKEILEDKLSDAEDPIVFLTSREFLCGMLIRGGAPDKQRLVEVVESIPAKRLTAAVDEDVVEATEVIATLAAAVRRSCFEISMSKQPPVKPSRGEACIRRLREALPANPAAMKLESTRMYAGLISATGDSLSDRPYSERVDRFLAALPSDEESESGLIFAMRSAMLDQILQLVVSGREGTAELRRHRADLVGNEKLKAQLEILAGDLRLEPTVRKYAQDQLMSFFELD